MLGKRSEGTKKKNNRLLVALQGNGISTPPFLRMIEMIIRIEKVVEIIVSIYGKWNTALHKAKSIAREG